MLQAAPGGGQKVRITLRACGITAKSTSWAMVLESAWGEQGQPWAEVPEQLGEEAKLPEDVTGRAEKCEGSFLEGRDSCRRWDHRPVLRAYPPPWRWCGRAIPAPSTIKRNLPGTDPAAAIPPVCEV